MRAIKGWVSIVKKKGQKIKKLAVTEAAPGSLLLFPMRCFERIYKERKSTVTRNGGFGGRESAMNVTYTFLPKVQGNNRRGTKELWRAIIHAVSTSKVLCRAAAETCSCR
jgi:hypothetical protein